MKTRREFFRSATALGLIGVAGLPSLAEAQSAQNNAVPAEDRPYWVAIAGKIARPVLENLARRTLKAKMPVKESPGGKRSEYTRLEAFGRLLCGLAPWLALDGLTGDELALQTEFRQLARQSMDAATDPKSPDFMNFTHGGQPVVDTAFLAQGILRAPKILWEPLDGRVKDRVIAALKSTRQISMPARNNWVMFTAMIETALLEFGEPTLESRLEDCVRKMLGWYVGDSVYGDGPVFHFDYYNSFVIHPMLVDVLGTLAKHDPAFAPAHQRVMQRARRFAVIQERLIAPDGTFPSLGRSTTYRSGAFHLAAQMAWLHQLPPAVKPAQLRCALTAVIHKTMAVPGTFDADGWLQIGFCGHQPSLGEEYISTGSLYLCSAGLLPLGLPATDEFWSAPAERWTSQKLWAGESLPADHALNDDKTIELPSLKR